MSDDLIEEEIQRLESERRRRKALARGGLKSTLALIGVALVVLALEVLTGWWLWSGMRPVWIGAALHGLAVALAGLAAWRVRPNEGPSRMLLLLALTLLFFGPFGPLGALMTLGLHAWFRRDATPFDEWYQSLFPEEVDEPSRRLYEMLTRGLADAASQENVTSFTDVLQYGSIEQKRAVISLLSRDFRPEFAPALQRALADTNPAVRVQAATAAANIEGDFLERAIELETQARKRPQDVEAQFMVARHFDNYAFSGILDGDRRLENQRKAEDFYRRTLDLDDTRRDAVLGVGRLLVRQSRLDEAIKWLEQGFANGFVDPGPVSWYMEAAYRQGDFDKMRYAVAAFGDDILEQPGVSERMKDVVRLWLGHEGPGYAEAGEMRLA